MKTKFIFLLILCFSVIAAHAQTEAVKVPAEVKPFVESGTKPIALESADLNGDGLKDFILVLERENPTETDEYDFPKNQRPLLILVRGKDKKLSEAKRNEKMVMCSQCGGIFGDPFAGLTVGKNTFTVNHYGGSAWRWTADYKFNYSRIDKTWQLVRIEKTSYHNVRPMEETLEKTVLTPPKDYGKVDIADFDPADYEEKEDESEPTGDAVSGKKSGQNFTQFINVSSVSANRLVNVKFSSVYTDLSKGCKSEGGDDGGHVSTICKGIGNYRIHYFDSAANLNFAVETNDGEDSISLGMQLLSYDTKNRKVEWRLADGKPFAVIIRMNKFEINDEGMPGKITGEYLLVKGLKGFENIDAEVDAKSKNANVEAQKIADSGFKQKPSAENFKTMDFSDFNKKIAEAAAKNEVWVKFPTQVIANWLPPFEEFGSRKIEMNSEFADVTDFLKVVVTDDQYADDSVRGERYWVEIKKDAQGVWQIVSAKRAWVCQQNRGHQDYSIKPCL